MPEYSGNTDELTELFYSFLEGVTTEEELRGICDRLMAAFGKGEVVRDGTQSFLPFISYLWRLEKYERCF